MNRRDFFKSFRMGFVNQIINERYVRPPYNFNEALYSERCPQCPAYCSLACEQDIIMIAKDETPYIDFTNKGCILCDKCAEVCDSGVLFLEGPKKLNAIAKLSMESCVAWQNNRCNECSKPCEPTAILFYDKLRPEVDVEACVGCGLCVHVCPEKAITMEVI